MYLTIASVVLAWLSGWCQCRGSVWGELGDDESALIGRWSSRFLGLAAVIFLAIALSVGCASSTLGKSLNVAVIGSGIADNVSTEYAIKRGAVEANPIMQGGAWQRAALKGLGIGAVLGLTHLAEIKGKPILAHVLRIVVIGYWTGVSLHNAGVQR